MDFFPYYFLLVELMAENEGSDDLLLVFSITSNGRNKNLVTCFEFILFFLPGTYRKGKV
jgi:hypothetical protein